MLDHLKCAVVLPALLLVALTSMVAAPTAAQEGGDMQAQILYAYEAEDSNRLADLVQSLSAQVRDGDAGPAVRYHLGHADYRYALLLGATRGRDSERALSDCVDQLGFILDKNAESVEALVLSAVCNAHLADFRRLEAVLLRSRAQDRLAAARALAPQNPRVLLAIATQALARAKPGTVEAQTAFAQLTNAAQRFEESSATDLDKPGWGHAEAYLALGHQLLLRGDRLGARNWIERALIAAPDYKAAARELATLERR